MAEKVRHLSAMKYRFSRNERMHSTADYEKKLLQNDFCQLLQRIQSTRMAPNSLCKPTLQSDRPSNCVKQTSFMEREDGNHHIGRLFLAAAPAAAAAPFFPLPMINFTVKWRTDYIEMSPFDSDPLPIGQKRPKFAGTTHSADHDDDRYFNLLGDRLLGSDGRTVNETIY